MEYSSGSNLRKVKGRNPYWLELSVETEAGVMRTGQGWRWQVDRIVGSSSLDRDRLDSILLVNACIPFVLNFISETAKLLLPFWMSELTFGLVMKSLSFERLGLELLFLDLEDLGEGVMVDEPSFWGLFDFKLIFQQLEYWICLLFDWD